MSGVTVPMADSGAHDGHMVGSRLLVLGIGNILLSDEGAGVEAVNQFARFYALPRGLAVLDGGTAGIDLMEPISGHDALIVVDAARLGRSPGTIEVWRDPALTRLARSRVSPHQFGLGDVFAKLTLLDQMPGRVSVIVIEPASIDLGLMLSPVVAARLDELVDLIAVECRAFGMPVMAKTDRAVTGPPRS